jgi:arsenate reductase
MKQRILFLCTGNTCRSQMAEGFARAFWGERFEVHSAGTEPGERVDPRAVAVMAETRVDISGQRPKHVSELAGIAFDYVVTVCDSASEACPVFPGAGHVLHRGFPDPPVLARDAQTEEQALDRYRWVRDEIRRFIEGLLEFAVGAAPRP